MLMIKYACNFDNNYISYWRLINVLDALDHCSIMFSAYTNKMQLTDVQM